MMTRHHSRNHVDLRIVGRFTGVGLAGGLGELGFGAIVFIVVLDVEVGVVGATLAWARLSSDETTSGPEGAGAAEGVAAPAAGLIKPMSVTE
jgi:hypothetical protein